ncbi:MAG TPA: hypothetical protein VGT02_17515 [Methylomirabilota bacterium]|nr:hypothetical protein [Methylomirabilota bacterium]
MSCHRCIRRTPDDAEPPVTPDASCEGHPPTALESLRQAVHGRSIQSPDAASEDSVEAPIRAAWIIS